MCIEAYTTGIVSVMMTIDYVDDYCDGDDHDVAMTTAMAVAMVEVIMVVVVTGGGGGGNEYDGDYYVDNGDDDDDDDGGDDDDDDEDDDDDDDDYYKTLVCDMRNEVRSRPIS